MIHPALTRCQEGGSVSRGARKRWERERERESGLRLIRGNGVKCALKKTLLKKANFSKASCVLGVECS